MTQPAENPEHKLILMGRIGAAHGIKGEVRLQSFCAQPLDIANYSPLSTDNGGKEIAFASVRQAGNGLIARIKGVGDRNAAEKLNGKSLFVSRSKLPKPGDGDFYQSDLIGLDVRLADGKPFGTIVAVPNFGAGDLIEVRLLSGNSEYFPFSRTIVPEIHFDKKFVILVPPAEIIGEEQK